MYASSVDCDFTLQPFLDVVAMSNRLRKRSVGGRSPQGFLRRVVLGRAALPPKVEFRLPSPKLATSWTLLSSSRLPARPIPHTSRHSLSSDSQPVSTQRSSSSPFPLPHSPSTPLDYLDVRPHEPTCTRSLASRRRWRTTCQPASTPPPPLPMPQLRLSPLLQQGRPPGRTTAHRRQRQQQSGS